MATEQRKRTRSERVATVELPPGIIGRTLGYLRRGDVLLRIGLCALTSITLWAVTAAWSPPFAFRSGYVPLREIRARINFELEDPAATEQDRETARNRALAVYAQDAQALAQLRSRLLIEVDEILRAESLDSLGAGVWGRFEPPLADGTPQPTAEERQQAFQRFQEVLTGEGAVERFTAAVEEVLAPFEQRGLLAELPQEHTGNLERILVYSQDKRDFPVEVEIKDVLLGSALSNLKTSLSEKLPSIELADRVFAWLKPQLPTTLKLDFEETQREQQDAINAVRPNKESYSSGKSVLAKANEPLGPNALELLWGEHWHLLAQQKLSSLVYRSLAIVGMHVALYTLCGFYTFYRAPELLRSLPRFFVMLCLVILTVTLSVILSHDNWRAEMVPLLLFGMTVAIAYNQELALLLSAAVTLLVVISIGYGLSGAVILMAAAAGAILSLGRVRSRSKLLLVGLCGGAVALLTTLGVGTLEGQLAYPAVLLLDALKYAMWAIIAGSLMTCLLPFIERWFGVQTELSLIELGDPAHPLLQELIRRAPGTYNHCITVASLAEAAAERIGARGLLVRVGAYFHDIGKMLKPGYFIENQGQGDNRHKSLVPAMSTLVIIAHVKDGADLARQHHLPDPIIDFIQQHHGTTLVEYFYRRASEQSESDPNGSEVDESRFRYPGPKPQTKEAGVLMLADAVESASRVLVEPTPSRIENLVDEITMKRLLDGQFDECGLTLKEVHAVSESLAKSLTAVYHGRVKYPDQQTA
jgi:putative nucleotidyltransferase with HDIG domain